MITPCSHFDCGNRTKLGYCKTTACINPMYNNLGTAQYGQGVQRNIITNADHIRAMTNEELAKLGAKGCPHSSARNMCAVCGDGCYRCWLDWLNQEVKDG